LDNPMPSSGAHSTGLKDLAIFCAKVVIDATGLGQAPAAFLRRTLGEARVEPFAFTLPSKSRLGYTLLALAGTGRLKV
jgi:hypothetical protein